MQQILKRLELIKTSIAIEDEEIIELQISKLSSMPIDDHVRDILNLLIHNDYGHAVIKIENYIERYSGVTVYEDKELGGLKLELKVLENKLQELSEEKNEYLNNIHEFNVQYNLHLGEIIREILRLKKEILYKLKNDDANIDNDEIFREYAEAKEDFENFESEYEAVVNQERYQLDEDQLAELKKAYRKASKLCHPDLVPDERQEQALKLMQELNEAYGKKDLKKVNQILSMLENGGGFDIASDAINDKELLRAKIEALRIKIDEMNNELNEIKSDDAFTTIQELDDWDEYFNALKIELDEEKERLEQQINTLEDDSNDDNQLKQPKETVNQEYDDYWYEKF